MASYPCCPDNLPLDAIGPGVRRQVTQVGYGGPFVIRGNPFGALIDTIRNFCFPVRMEEDTSGQGYYDAAGLGLSSPSLNEGAYVGAAQPLQGGSSVPNISLCPSGQEFDAATLSCRSKTTATPGTPAAVAINPPSPSVPLVSQSPAVAQPPTAAVPTPTPGAPVYTTEGDLPMVWARFQDAVSRCDNEACNAAAAIAAEHRGESPQWSEADRVIGGSCRRMKCKAPTAPPPANLQPVPTPVRSRRPGVGVPPQHNWTVQGFIDETRNAIRVPAPRSPKRRVSTLRRRFG